MKMKKLRSLLLDANVVIKLFELGVWDCVVENCEILLSRTVAETEVEFYEKDELQERIDLSRYVNQNLITIVDVKMSDVINFRNLFDPTYFIGLTLVKLNHLFICWGLRKTVYSLPGILLFTGCSDAYTVAIKESL